jgi:sec-independent protein translocase protein TatC
MAEESESESPDGTPADDEPPETAADSPEAADDSEDHEADADAGTGAFDPETDTIADPDDDVPGGSIEDYLDDESAIGPDEQAPMGATGTPDPYDEDERQSVSDAIGAPVPDSELESDPELELDPSVVSTDEDDASTDAATDDDATRRGDDPSDRIPADAPINRGDDAGPSNGDSVIESSSDSVVETDPEPASDAVGEPTSDADGGDEPSVEAGGASDLTAADDDLDDGLLGEGPASDEEMPLAAHIEEMVRRLAVVLVLGGVVALAVFPVADQLINFLWNSHIPGAETIVDRRPRLYGPLELVLTELKVAALAGFVVGLPVAVYETYLFMRPGLFPRERRYYLAAVPTSLVLALIGVAFAHFVVLPAIFAYFTAYTTGTAVVAFGLKETFSLILVLMGYMALVFQIPLFIMLAIMMNLTTRIWLEDRRLLFWGGFLGVAFLVSPDPTGMAPIIVAATMITLFEGTLALLRWTGN